MVLIKVILPVGSGWLAGADDEELAFEGADGEGLGPFDRAAGLELGDGAEGVEAAGVTGGLELAAANGAGAEVAAGPATAGDGAGDSAAGEPEEAAGADAEGPAALFDAVHPAVTRTGTSTSAAAIRRIPPSSPTPGQFPANCSPVGPGLTPWRAGPYSWGSARFKCAHRCVSIGVHCGVACPR